MFGPPDEFVEVAGILSAIDGPSHLTVA